MFLVGGVPAVFSGCNFLDVDEPGQNDIPKFFSNMEGMRIAREGIYSELLNVFDGTYTKYVEIVGDLLEPGSYSDTELLKQFNFRLLPEDRAAPVMSIWERTYSAIANFNNILKYGPELKKSFPNNAAEIDLICAEALFARALCHLALCNIYGQSYNFTPDASHLGVPIATRLADVNEMTARNTVGEVYKRITDDLTAALSIFGEPDKVPADSKWSYYITPQACKALQARVYLYMGNYEAARDCATALIDVMSLTPYNEYVAMCRSVNDEAGRESIFKLSTLGKGGGGMHSYFFTSGGSPATAVASTKLIDMFDRGDIRATLIEQRNITKFRSPRYDEMPIPEASLIPYGFPVLRLSEMYLIRAEANCKLKNTGLAAEDLKAIIGRATDTPAANVTLNGTSEEALMETIARERCLEFYGEGLRFFDIVRWKQNLVRAASIPDGPADLPNVKRMNYPNDHFVLPIPHDETSVNTAIIQNPGY
jgi:tetratricopeptide (TPR) repeat protein